MRQTHKQSSEIDPKDLTDNELALCWAKLVECILSTAKQKLTAPADIHHMAQDLQDLQILWSQEQKNHTVKVLRDNVDELKQLKPEFIADWAEMVL